VSHHKNDYKYPAGFACDTCHYIQWLATRFFAQCLHRAFSEKAKAHLLAQNKKTFEVGGNEGSCNRFGRTCRAIPKPDWKSLSQLHRISMQAAKRDELLNTSNPFQVSVPSKYL